MNGLLSRMEFLIGAVLVVIFLFWAGSRCKETKVPLQEETQKGAITDSLAAGEKKVGEQSASDDILAEALRKKQGEITAQQAAADSTKAVKTASTDATATDQEATPAASKLYITIDKLKVRSAPGLESKVLGEMPLFSEVYFMNEVTDSIYTLNLGKEIAHEPYVKIKTKRGTIGWVYGAGVNYYKKKREGVLE